MLDMIMSTVQSGAFEDLPRRRRQRRERRPPVSAPRRVQVLIVTKGRVVCSSLLVQNEIARIETQLLPHYEKQGARCELWAWFARNAIERARAALKSSDHLQLPSSYAELQGYRD